MFNTENQDENNAWLSLSDMMTVLMVLFLVIAIITAISATSRLNEVTGRVKNLIDQEEKLCETIEDNLYETFLFSSSDLSVKCNPIRVIFTNPDYVFQSGRAELSPNFKSALKKFFPVYLETVRKWDLAEAIDEIRIEGHTDSDGSYIDNMRLSQNRSRNVLAFAINLPEVRNSEDYSWIQSLLTANGLSYSRRLDKDGNTITFNSNQSNLREDKEKSRRVEIKLRTQVKEILLFLNGQKYGS